RDDTNTAAGENSDKFQTNWSAADDNRCIAGQDSRFFNTSQHASQGFDECRVNKREMRRNLDDVLVNNTSGNQRIFCVGAIIENEILTEICSLLQTEEALVAWSRVRGHHTHAGPETVTDAFTSLLHNARQFVPENSRRHNHAGMITLLPDFEVRP